MQFVVKFITRQRAGGHRDGAEAAAAGWMEPKLPFSLSLPQLRPLFRRAGTYLDLRTLEKASGKISD